MDGFVGRAAERALLAELVSSRGAAAIFVHGPGGSGKSTLISAFAHDAEQAGLSVLTLDVDGSVIDRDGIRAQFRRCGGGRCLVLFDNCRHPDALTRWLRRHWRDDVPDDAIVVIASRSAPPLELLAIGWPARVESVAVGDFTAAESHAYLRAAGVDAGDEERLAALGQGNPLALSLLTQLALTRPADLPVHALEENMACVRQLLDGIVEPIRSSRRRRALQLCAKLRYTDEDLLGAAIPGDVHSLFEWLRRLPYVAEGSRGLTVAPLVRTIVSADFRWRDNPAFLSTQAILLGEYVRRMRNRAVDVHTAFTPAFDGQYLRRERSAALWGIDYGTDWSSPEDLSFDPYTPELAGDLRAALATVPDKLALRIRNSIERAPHSCAVFRRPSGEIVAFGTRDRYTQASLSRSRDPAPALVRAHTDAHGAARDGETISVTRVDAFPAVQSGYALACVMAWVGCEAGRDARCAWDAVVTPGPENWSGPFAYLDFHHVGGYRDEFTVYAHDWRRLDVNDWFQMLLDQPVDSPPREPTGVSTRLPLGEAEFAAAVRQAMRDLRHDSRLAANPLIDSRVVRRGEPELSPARRLREALREEALALRAEHTDMYAIIDRTYLRPSATQEQVAEVMGLAFTTYRRRRNRGIELITAALWARERGLSPG